MLPRADLHAPRRGRATRCAGATRRSTSRASAPSTLGLEGAAFPWRTIRGQECSGYWPAGTAAFHINADIAEAVIRYCRPHRRRRSSSATSGSSCWSRRRGCGARSATTTPQGAFRIDGVTGPDEYTALADNNVYTNLMAQRNLRAAAECVARHPDEADALGVDAEEAASWRDAASQMVDPLRRRARRPPPGRGLHAQRGAGTSSARRPSSTRCCCTSRTSTSTASRSSSRPTWCWRCSSAATRSRPSRRRATSPTTRRSPCATRRCRRARRRSWRPRSATSSSPTTTSPRRR